MDSLLNISSSRRITEVQEDALVSATKSVETEQSTTEGPLKVQVNSATEVLNILQDKPSFENLRLCLKWLLKREKAFDIKAPGPVSTQIIGVLVSDVIPSYWAILSDSTHVKERQWLLNCLTSTSGLGALVAKLKVNHGTAGAVETASIVKDKNKSSETLEVLDLILQGNHALSALWVGLSLHTKTLMQQQILWKELISLFASGRLVSVVAEHLVHLEDRESHFSWLGEGGSFTKWLGENIRMLALSSDKHGNEVYGSAASMLGRALSLGHTEKLIEASFYGLLHGRVDNHNEELELFGHLNPSDQTKCLSSLLSALSQKFNLTVKQRHQQLISGCSALLKRIVDRSSHLQNFIVNWLACLSGNCVVADLGLRRAVIAAVSLYEGVAQETVKKLLTQFGDKIHIQHAPIVLQEVCSQNLLLLVGRIYRKDRQLLKTIARSSIFINAISNRLAASSERPRVLGMVVGMAISELVDDADKRMKFSDALNGSDTDWYMELTGIQDNIGKLDDLKLPDDAGPRMQSEPVPQPRTKRSTKPKKTIPQPSLSKIISIESVSSDDDDIPMYEKPDSDAEDSDDDPTLINRNKPTPPVYIRDLIVYLKDTENYDRHVLAMSHAASLIRRKSEFGTEVTDHIEDLASLLCGLKDEHDIESWGEQRLAGMVAIILAQPTSMGKWFANMVFSGDYSMSQRASMLTAITLAARELAGYASDDAELTKAPDPSEQIFPSKQLPAKYAKLYTQSTAAITSAARDLETKILQPLAAQALDSANNAPAILKTRTFSSRMAVESRKKPINNKLATLLSESFFYPLTNRWQVFKLSHSSTNVFQTPFLQAHLLKTLTLLLAAAGNSTLALPQLTVEFWGILLSPSTRTAASEALPVLEAVLFGLLTLLDINGAGAEGEDRAKRRLAEECGESLVETQAWVGLVLERFGGGSTRAKGSGEEERIRMLAAGVMIRVEEVVERYQRLLMGALAGV